MILKSWGPKRITNKILLLVLSLEFVSIFFWGSLTYSASRNELHSSIANRMNEIANRASSDIANFFLPVIIEANSYSQNIQYNQEKREIMLHGLMNKRPELEDASVVDKHGAIRFNASRIYGDKPEVMPNRDLIRMALMGVESRSDFYLSDHLDPKIKLGFPIKQWASDSAALILTLNLSWLWDSVQKEKIDNTGYIYVVDKNLKIIAHPDPSYVKIAYSLDNLAIPSHFFSHGKRKKLSFYKNINGVPVMGLSYFDPNNNWWIIVEQPTAEGLASLDRLIRRFLLVLLMALVVTTLIVTIFSHLTMRPLARLRASITELSRGQLEPIPVDNSTELGELAQAFNNMATDILNKQEKLQYLANNDSLTGLNNRHYLYDRIELDIHDAIKLDHPFALMLIDLDHFKDINDTLGHRWGDTLLKELGTKLKDNMKTVDTLARLGGDEFAIVYKCHDSIQALQFAEKVRDVIQQSIQLEGVNIQIDGSIGIAMCPEHTVDATSLLRFADIAMYSAKNTGHGCEVYSPDMDLNSPFRLELMGGLRNAINSDQLRLYYQPKIDIRSGKAIGLEALIRWQHPDHGLLLPSQFIPISELSEVIQMLTYWVVNRACIDLKQDFKTFSDLKIAVNVSALNLEDVNFARNVIKIIENNHIAPNLIQLEVTETAIMSDISRARDSIFRLADEGLEILIDDFGTGYSSMNYLKNLPFNELKIDKSFVIDMDKDNHENDAVIVRSIIDLAHNLGMNVTSEGVETESVLSLLQILRCDFAQGYLFSQPMPLNVILDWLWQNQKYNNQISI